MSMKMTQLTIGIRSGLPVLEVIFTRVENGSAVTHSCPINDHSGTFEFDFGDRKYNLTTIQMKDSEEVVNKWNFGVYNG